MIRKGNFNGIAGTFVEVGVSIVLSKNSRHHEDSKIDIAKKRYDLEREKTELFHIIFWFS